MSKQSHMDGNARPGLAWWAARLSLVVGGLLVALVIAELGLRLAGLPRVHEPHSEPIRFAFAKGADGKEVFYVNQPGRITFRYDSNPRGYFGENHEVHHDVNPTGFRGPALRPKADDVFRIVFLGDSFTFGEGVRNEDTFAEVTARELRESGARVEACNLGVGGYNTTQSLETLKRFGLGLEPDVVVLGYTLNDAEPPLFTIDPETGQGVRRDREQDIEAEAAPKRPPESGIYRLKLAKLLWSAKRQRELSRQTTKYYLAVNEAESPGAEESMRALRQAIAECKSRDIPCVVVMFPLLFELNDDYPFKEVHARVGKVVESSGGHFIDLLPELMGEHPAKLIVHHTDQHPNETVHALAGSLLAERISKLSGIDVK